jgi:hypothetical protein
VFFGVKGNLDADIRVAIYHKPSPVGDALVGELLASSDGVPSPSMSTAKIFCDDGDAGKTPSGDTPKRPGVPVFK